MELIQALPWLSPSIALAALTYTILSNRSRAEKAEFEKFAERVTLRQDHLTAKVEVLEDRVSKIEGEIQHLPGKETVHEVKLALERLSGQVLAMSTEIKPIGKIADRLQEYLLEQVSSGRGR